MDGITSLRCRFDPVEVLSGQGLLVAADGFHTSVSRETAAQLVRVRLWDADGFIDQILEQYDRLPEDLRAELQLKRIRTITGLHLLRQEQWTDNITPGTRVTVEVANRPPHTVTLAQPRAWAEGTAVNPTEMLKKRKLLALLPSFGPRALG
jgi:hypothetical protein